MKSIVLVVLALAAVAVAAPPDFFKILRSDYQQQPEGSYNFVYETENGLKRQETGELKSVTGEDNKPQNVVVVRGTYEYPGEDGKPVLITYEADEFGYKAVGDSIPKPASR